MTNSEAIIDFLLIGEAVLTRQTITSAIQKVLAEYIQNGEVKCAYDVGSGPCEQFAEDVRASLGSPASLQAVEYAELTGPLGCKECDEIFYPETLEKFQVRLPPDVTVELLNKSGLGEIGTHVFLRWKSTGGYIWFDAEAPQGVGSPFDLPFAQRYLNIARLHNWR